MSIQLPVTKQAVDALLTRGVAEVIEPHHLKQRLLAGETLRIKFGIDPTSSDIHLGRSVPLLKLRDLQEMGHQIVFIIGDFTGMIGDTSDKESERPMLTREQVKSNMQHYLKQAFKILEPKKTETHYNSEWLSRLDLLELGKMASTFSLHEFAAREGIAKRLARGSRVSFHEILYPLFQGYDSVAVRADVELGGTDQRFNLLAGRKLQGVYGQKPQDILMTNLILGNDGRKMSSSWGNTINLLDTPKDMFGKVMSLPDELMMEYFVHCTRVPMAEVNQMAEEIVMGANPRDIKLRLARSLVALYYDDEAGRKAEMYFVETFSQGRFPSDMVVQSVERVDAERYESIESFIVRSGLAASKSEARRKIEQGGVSIDGEKIRSGVIFSQAAHAGKVLKVGKKDFLKIVFPKL